MTDQWADIIKTLLTALLGAGGTGVIWITQRRDNATKASGHNPTMKDAAEVAPPTLAPPGATPPVDPAPAGIATDEQDYLDRLEARFNARLAEMDTRLAASELRNEALQRQTRRLVQRDLAWYAHTGRLERHINDGAPPPPPQLPAELLASVLDVIGEAQPPA